MVGLPGRFSNIRPSLKTLIRGVLRGSEGRRSRARASERHDTRGPVAKERVQSQTRLTSQRRTELVADYLAGMPVRAIAAKYGVHRSTVPVMVRREGAKVRVAGLEADQSLRASFLYSSGMTLMEVAQHMKISDEAVRQAVLDLGGQIRARGRRSRATQ